MRPFAKGTRATIRVDCGSRGEMKTTVPPGTPEKVSSLLRKGEVAERMVWSLVYV